MKTNSYYFLKSAENTIDLTLRSHGSMNVENVHCHHPKEMLNLCKIFMKIRNRFNPFVIVGYIIFFIGAM